MGGVTFLGIRVSTVRLSLYIIRFVTHGRGAVLRFLGIKSSPYQGDLMTYLFIVMPINRFILFACGHRNGIFYKSK